MPTTTDPVMNLVLPTVSAQPGPTWAVDINTALTRIASHTHEAGYGVQVKPAGLYLNSDVTLNAATTVTGNNLTGLRSARLVDQSGDISGASDVGCVYRKGNDLYWNNSASTHVQITSGGTVFATGTASISWPIDDLEDTDITIAPTDIHSFYAIDTSGGPRVVTLPVAADVAAGRFFWIGKKSGSNTITVNTSGDTIADGTGSDTSVIISGNFATVCFVSNGVDEWYTVRSAQEVNGAAVTAAGSLTTNHVLHVSGSKALSYGYIVNANVDAAAAIDGTKIASAASGALGVIKLAQDLAGTALLPTVIAVSGAGGTTILRSAGRKLQWEAGASLPTLTQADNGMGGPGTKMVIQAQNGGASGQAGGILALTSGSDLTANETSSGNIQFNLGSRSAFAMSVTGATSVQFGMAALASAGNGNNFDIVGQPGLTTGNGGGIRMTAGAGVGGTSTGGNLVLTAGVGVSSGGGGTTIISGGSSPSGLGGSVALWTGTSGGLLIEASNVGAGQRVVSLCLGTYLDALTMPASSGDGVIYIANASTAPTASCSGGGILYVQGGALKYRGSSGTMSTLANA